MSLTGGEQLYVSIGGTPITINELMAFLQANMAGLQSAAATDAIAALSPTSTAADIVAALQAT
ncbi:hypothetical protein [Bordetella hinzii]|uniref:hypothetical protein n=1 Tax=Bordetella hinzii TaxID=103855 RepID=UPI0039FCB8A4